MYLTEKKGKQFIAVDLKQSDINQYYWSKFSLNEIQIRACLAGLACHLEEVCIISTETSFTIFAVSDHIEPVLSFYKKFNVSNHITICNNSELALTNFIEHTSAYDLIAQNKINMTLLKSYTIALEAGSIGYYLENYFKKMMQMLAYKWSLNHLPKTVLILN